MVPMQCALCREEAELQNSHIIPEFLYGVMYDEKHRYNVLSLLPESRERFEQKGVRERLLCRNCEQKLGKLERYASLVLHGGAPGMDGYRDGSIVYVKGINYTKFKLFQLSLLWRAGVAKGSYFERVRLGPHEEPLRAMLAAEDPGPYDLYPCIIWGVTLEPNKIAELMVQPCRDRVWGYTTYHFVLPGLKLVYFVSRQRLPRKQSQFVLQHDGSLIFQVRSVLEMPIVTGFMEKFESGGSANSVHN